MALFRDSDKEKRRRLAVAIAMAAHVERNIPQVFSAATTDRLELAADELAGDEDLSFETITVVKRALQALESRNTGRPWSTELISALRAIDDVED
jgi:hypothetical protein